jgi:hypothetical protein
MSGNQTKDSCPDQRRERIIKRHLEPVEKFLNEDIISDFKTLIRNLQTKFNSVSGK